MITDAFTYKSKHSSAGNIVNWDYIYSTYKIYGKYREK